MDKAFQTALNQVRGTLAHVVQRIFTDNILKRQKALLRQKWYSFIYNTFELPWLRAIRQQFITLSIIKQLTYNKQNLGSDKLVYYLLMAPPELQFKAVSHSLWKLAKVDVNEKLLYRLRKQIKLLDLQSLKRNE